MSSWLFCILIPPPRLYTFEEFLGGTCDFIVFLLSCTYGFLNSRSLVFFFLLFLLVLGGLCLVERV